ncbi:hypothetical protein FB379_11544 [Aeribacillus composti]|jgi:hypothetical protein|uniref:UDP-N-acetylglucosamine 2-epimerase n=1 Tax=Aeribacillus composti TaxID=1868734 RepID=UPI00119AF26F|nr:UDP-N-acetylglucosamine 2-epimerase [Aeribacillus composti]MED1441244.1 hypothetical protein [Aeribacillus composti]TVZ81906.1 hypothetical protein FB379_11544 [Aeribacillus composti]
MNICFITCFYKTELFFEISKEIKSNKKIYWITPSYKWYNWLLKKGIKPEEILLITKDKVRNNKRSLLTVENNSYGLNLTSIALMDRILRSMNGDYSINYLTSLGDLIKSFIIDKDIDVVFGEATAAHEILTSVICDILGKYFFNPFTVRIPSNRFVFFKGPFQSEIYQFKKSRIHKTDMNKIINEIIDSVVIYNKKPDYYYINNQIPRFNFSLIKTIIVKLFESLIEAKYDQSVKSLKYQLLIEKKYLRPLRYKINILKSVFQNADYNRDYALYTLHKQPEASIDVLGYRHSNQLELIREIALNLPDNVKLYVKEHSNSLGERSLYFYRKLTKIPNVVLINPFEDTRKLIENSLLVLTVSGTVALEAGIIGKKAVTFSKMFFNELNNVFYINDPMDIKKILYCNKKNDKKSPEDYYRYIIQNSFEGTISDTISTPQVLDRENVKKIAFGFNSLIDDLKV